jgi:hypothetical protein
LKAGRQMRVLNYLAELRKLNPEPVVEKVRDKQANYIA